MMKSQIYDIFYSSLQNHGLSDHDILNLWQKLDGYYSQKNRYYHNWQHIQTMIEFWETNKSYIENPKEVLLAIYYHDAIYKVSRKDNELKSAQLAKQHLSKSKDIDLILIENLILCTAQHNAQTPDESYLVDFDLQILGRSWDIYQVYASQIRKEYRVYPSFIYNPGRIKALEHFLNTESIFKTNIFQQKFELQARKNIQSEIESLH